MVNSRNAWIATAIIVLGTITTPLVYAAGSQDTEQKTAGGADGYRASGFLLRPEAALSATYDSNIFATRNDEVDDRILVLTPTLSAVSDWKSHQLKFNAGGSFGRYEERSDEDYDDYWGEVEGRYDLSKYTNVFGSLGYMFDHESRGSPEDELSGKEPTTFASTSAHAGLSHSWGTNSLRMAATFEQLDFDNVAPLNNDDRDRDLLGLGVRLSYRINSRYTVYLQGVGDVRDYQARVDDNGYERGSDGYRAGIGVLARFSNRLKGAAYGGWFDQTYDDPRFSDAKPADFGGNLTWRPASKTTWSARLDRSLEETTVSGASGYLYTVLNGDLRHLLTPRLSVNVGLSFAQADYRGLHLQDDYYTAKAGMRYYLSPRWYLGAEYRVLTRDSGSRESLNNPANRQDLDSFSRNQFFVSLGTLLYPVRQGAYWDTPSGELLALPAVDASGFHVGVQLGQEAFSVQSDGTGDSTDIHKGQFSNSGTGGGLFAGYGFFINRWYYGLELEAATSDAGLDYEKSADNGSTLALDKGDSLGAAFRVGYQLPGGSLLYGRAGAVKTDFDSFYTVNNEPGNAARDNPDGFGIRYGLGTDIPVKQHLFVRLDYSYTEYDDYSADIGAITQDINPREDLFRVGIGWQFDGPNESHVPVAIKISGPYAGVQGGHGALQSELNGSHSDSDGTGGALTSDVSGDFGYNSGFTSGVFVGYGFNREHWYFGLEGELDNSSVDWNFADDAGGRKFAVNRQGSWGFNLRGGYTLSNGALLYARAGQVHTGFNTEWSKNADSVNDIDRDDTVEGFRYGVGAEIPVSRSGFVRFDYTFTDYENYNFATFHGNSDRARFDNSETLFRLGIGVRF